MSTDPAMSPSAKLALIRQAMSLRLPLYETKTLTYLASLIGPGGVSWPSTRSIADACAMDRRNAERAVRGLIARGLLEIAQAGNRAKSARYRVSISAIEDAAVASPQTQGWRLYRRKGGVSTDATGGVSTDAVRASEALLSASEAQCAANARGGCADAAPPRARGGRATSKTKPARRRASRTPAPVAVF